MGIFSMGTLSSMGNSPSKFYCTIFSFSSLAVSKLSTLSREGFSFLVLLFVMCQVSDDL